MDDVEVQVNVLVAHEAIAFTMASPKAPLNDLRKQMGKELKAALCRFPVGWLFLLNGVPVMKAQEKKFTVGQIMSGSSISVAADATATMHQHAGLATEVKAVAPEVAAATVQKESEKAAKAAAKEQEKAEKAAAKAERDAAKAAKEAEKENARLAKEAAKAQKEQEQSDAKAEREQAKAAKEAEKADKERARALKAAEKERKALEPKMPCSAYTSFVRMTSAEFRAAHPEAKPPEVIKLQAAAWKELSAEERATHDQRAEEDLQRYLAECEAAGTEPKRGKKQQQQQQQQLDPIATAKSAAPRTPGWLREAAGAVGLVDELETPSSDVPGADGGGDGEFGRYDAQTAQALWRHLQLQSEGQPATPRPAAVAQSPRWSASTQAYESRGASEDASSDTHVACEEEDDESVLVSNLSVINVD